MPNQESLIEKIAEIVNDNQEDEVLVNSLDMNYAYG